ncbi:MAG: transcription elongation factor GreA [Planctomycetota bacterium]
MELITADEKAQLEQRLNDLIVNRPKISNRIAEARELGDLKENSEYHSAREQQGLEEAEIRRLEERLATAKVVEAGSTAEGVVFLGSTVKLREIDTGDEDFYRLVGEASGQIHADYDEVTTSSPMGEALMKARVGETISVRGPRGVMKFEIVEIT